MANGITVYGNRRTQIVSALTQWDERQRIRDKHHNSHFLGIALQAFDYADDAAIEADPRGFILDNYSGRCAAFIIKALGLEPMTDKEYR
jgi:hypothetical protein